MRRSRTARSRASSLRRFERGLEGERQWIRSRHNHIGGDFVESHGREVMDVVRPIDRQVIARVTLADEEDTRRAIAAATSARSPHTAGHRRKSARRFYAGSTRPRPLGSTI
jgi:hypothetical protein